MEGEHRDQILRLLFVWEIVFVLASMIMGTFGGDETLYE